MLFVRHFIFKCNLKSELGIGGYNFITVGHPQSTYRSAKRVYFFNLNP